MKLPILASFIIFLSVVHGAIKHQTKTSKEKDQEFWEKEMKGKAKNQPTRNYTPSGEKPRSLHYIDADDDETPAPAQKPAPKKDETPKESNSLIAQAPLKDDEKDEPAKDEASSEENATNDNE